MSRWTLPLCCLALLWAAPCFGVIILQKDNPTSIKGFLVRQNDERVVVNELLPSGETRQRVVQRSDIDVMIVSVAPERLAALRPDQPQTYRDYADELSEKREDPEARNVAIRLYLLTASLDPSNQGRGALLSMAGLARSPEEERKFRAMVYLLDPAHDRNVLKPPSMVATTRTELSDSERKMLLAAIRALRVGNGREAQNYARRPLFHEAFQHLESVLTLDTFTAAAAQRNVLLSNSLLQQLIAAELVILNLPQGDRPPGADVPWSTLVKAKQDAPITALSLETITEFNPRETVFRDQRWSVPE